MVIAALEGVERGDVVEREEWRAPPPPLLSPFLSQSTLLNTNLSLPSTASPATLNPTPCQVPMTREREAARLRTESSDVPLILYVKPILSSELVP